MAPKKKPVFDPNFHDTPNVKDGAPRPNYEAAPGDAGKMTAEQLGMSRRRFFEQSTLAMGTLAAALGTGKQAMAAKDALLQRRHLIVIQPTGGSGWDGQSFQSSFNPEFMDSVNLYTDFASSVTDRTNAWTPRTFGLTSGEGMTGFKHPNYPDGRAYLGPGMSIFQGTGLLEKNMAIAVGTWSDGGHNVGSEVICNGNRSRYAIGFASLIAQELGKNSTRALNYVQINAPGGSYSHTGFLGGMAEPANIADSGALGNLIKPSASDVPMERRAALDKLVTGLARDVAMSGLKLRTSKELFGAFATAYEGASKLATGNWLAPGSKLSNLWIAYRAEIDATVRSHAFFKRYQDTETAGGTNLADSFMTNTLMGMDQMAFRFAFAEFLISENLSSVVELPGNTIDAHGYTVEECIRNLAMMTGFKRLALNLRDVHKVSQTDDRPLLDVTSIVMFTEWDRWPHLSGDKSRPGTDHGRAASIVFAGGGFAGGSYVGGIQHGENDGPFGTHFLNVPANASIAAADRVPLDAGQPLRINHKTGKLDPNGEFFWIENVFPTVMSLFDVTTPGQQLTNYAAVDGLTFRRKKS